MLASLLEMSQAAVKMLDVLMCGSGTFSELSTNGTHFLVVRD